MRILVVEGDPIQAEAVSRALGSLNHTVRIVDDGERAVSCLQSEPIDAVVMDWHLPRLSGIEVLRWIRARSDVQYGVLLLTSRAQEMDVVPALEAGADDYMVKPFRAEELAARVNALLRRVSRKSDTPEKPVRVGNYVLDTGERCVTLDGNEIELTTKEFALVASLFNNLGRIVSRDYLAMTAWGRELSVESRSLDTHMYRIRRKLKLKPENGLRLTSIYTLGYRLDLVKVANEPQIRLLRGNGADVQRGVTSDVSCMLIR